MIRVEEKNRKNIELPARIILSDDGIDYFTRKRIASRDIRTREGVKKSGFQWDSLKGHLFQRMFVNKLIEEIEIDRVEFMDKRIDIIDLTKLLIYGILYKKFRACVRNFLSEADAIQSIIRRSPGKSGSEGLNLKPESVLSFVKENVDLVKFYKNSFLEDPFNMVEMDHSLNEQQKIEKKQIFKKFIDELDNRVWFLYHFARRSENHYQIIRHLNNILSSFVKRTKIADYVALMQLEVMQNFEKLHFQWLADSKRHLFRENNNSRIDIQDRTVREVLLNYAVQNRIFMHLNYRLDSSATRSDGRVKLQVTFRNMGLILDQARKNIQELASTDTKEISLARLYYQNNISETEENLGLYYLSFLEEACKEEGIRFDSRITADHSTEETVTMFFLTF